VLSVLRAAKRFAALVLTLPIVLVPVVAESQTPSAADILENFPSTPVWSHPVSTRPLTSPAAAGDRLFLAVQSGLAALRLSDGSEIWRADIQADGPMVVAGERLIVPLKQELRGVDAATGQVVWTDSPGVLTAPLYVHEDWLFVATGESLTAYRPADGSKVWTSDTGAIEQRPTVDGTRLYVPVADGRLVALDLNTGKSVWEYEIGIKPSEPYVYGDQVFVGSAAKLFCSLKKLNGTQEWCWPVGAAVVGAAVADQARVYSVALDNLLRAYDRRSGRLIWKQDLKYRAAAGPSLLGHLVCAPGTEPRLQAFDGQSGKPAGQLVLADKLVVVPVFLPGNQRQPSRIVALSGGLQNQWTLTLVESPPYSPPTPPVAPVTVLPGRLVPVGALTVPPERP
jgi:outer membrane protein assembly factor BamB